MQMINDKPKFNGNDVRGVFYRVPHGGKDNRNVILKYWNKMQLKDKTLVVYRTYVTNTFVYYKFI